MNRRKKQADIDCPIGLFARQEGEVSRVTGAMNRAATVTEKAAWGQVLIEAVEVLLGCEQYDEDSLHCRLCQEFSELRRKTAALVIKAGQLSDRRRRL